MAARFSHGNTSISNIWSGGDPSRREVLGGLGGLAGLAALALGGCRTGAPEGPATPTVAPPSAEPIGFAVARITLEERYVAPGQSPNIDHRVTPPPVEALRQWAAQRLVATGGRGTLAAVIEEASLTEERLDVDGGLAGLFADEPSHRYVLTLAVSLTADTLAGGGAARAEATVTRTMMERADAAERAAAWAAMTAAAIGEFDRRMEAEIRNNLGPLVV